MYEIWEFIHEIDFNGPFPKCGCVYLLMLDDEVRYIGQTKDLNQRMMNDHFHSLAKIFNKVWYFKCENKVIRLQIEE